MNSILLSELEGTIETGEEIFWCSKPDFKLHCHRPLRLACSFGIVAVSPVIWLLISLIDPHEAKAGLLITSIMVIILEFTVLPLFLAFMLWFLIAASQIWSQQYFLTDRRFIIKAGRCVKSIYLSQVLDIEIAQEQLYREKRKANIRIYSIEKDNTPSVVVLYAVPPP